MNGNGDLIDAGPLDRDGRPQYDVFCGGVQFHDDDQRLENPTWR